MNEYHIRIRSRRRLSLGELFAVILSDARENLGREPWFIRFSTNGEDGRRRHHEFIFN